MTKAQEIYERVEALVAAGTRKADAFRSLADEYGQPFNSIRGAYYAHTRSTGEGGNGTRRQARSVDPIESATAVLRAALEAIDLEVVAAKEQAEQAQQHYAALRDSAKKRKAALEAKIEVLQK